MGGRYPSYWNAYFKFTAVIEVALRTQLELSLQAHWKVTIIVLF